MLIIVDTNDNHSAVKLLDFYGASISLEKGVVEICYEDVDQIASICRILVAENIEILQIYKSD